MNDIDSAASALLAGHLVIMPTETVYGLAARADDRAAVARIYSAKGRPLDHPVIVHVADSDDALMTSGSQAWVREVPDYARALADAFWPGPLTLVLKRAPRAADHVTGAQDTVAIRVPRHPLARQVIDAMDRREPGAAPHGLAAPSANRFGQVSPTTLQHALDELGPYLDPARDTALDGGACDVGVESTIVDCTGPAPSVLRPGAVSVADVERVTGLLAEDSLHGIRVPGALPSHYAPRASLALAVDAEAMAAYVQAALAAGARPSDVAVIAPSPVQTPDGSVRLLAPHTVNDYARGLYSALRAADQSGAQFIVAILPDPDPSGVADAIIDRLVRAAAPRAADQS